MKPIIALSAGHYPASPGACCVDTRTKQVVACEFELALEWRETMAALLRERDYLVHLVQPAPLSNKIREINNLQSPSIALEIHFNAAVDRHGNYVGSGSETLFCPGSSHGEQLATSIQKRLGEICTPSRGAKHGWYWMDVPGRVDYAGDVDGDEVVDAFLVKTYCPSVIVEPDFIHRHHVIRQHKLHGCDAIVRGIVHWVESHERSLNP